MNREIKFRGIREKTGEWVYGYLVMREEPFLHDIISPIGNQSACTWAIKRGSEGQYTGLKDKYGVEIYEGDILSYFGFEYEVIFEESAFGWYEGGQFYAFAEMAIDEIAKTKIIGNRYENSELLKEEPTC